MKSHLKPFRITILAPIYCLLLFSVSENLYAIYYKVTNNKTDTGFFIEINTRYQERADRLNLKWLSSHSHFTAEEVPGVEGLPALLISGGSQLIRATLSPQNHEEELTRNTLLALQHISTALAHPGFSHISEAIDDPDENDEPTILIHVTTNIPEEVPEIMDRACKIASQLQQNWDIYNWRTMPGTIQELNTRTVTISLSIRSPTPINALYQTTSKDQFLSNLNRVLEQLTQAFQSYHLEVLVNIDRYRIPADQQSINHDKSVRQHLRDEQLLSVNVQSNNLQRVEWHTVRNSRERFMLSADNGHVNLNDLVESVRERVRILKNSGLHARLTYQGIAKDRPESTFAVFSLATSQTCSPALQIHEQIDLWRLEQSFIDFSNSRNQTVRPEQVSHGSSQEFLVQFILEGEERYLQIHNIVPAVNFLINLLQEEDYTFTLTHIDNEDTSESITAARFRLVNYTSAPPSDEEREKLIDALMGWQSQMKDKFIIKITEWHPITIQQVTQCYTPENRDGFFRLPCGGNSVRQSRQENEPSNATYPPNNEDTDDSSCSGTSGCNADSASE